ncbi:MAG: Ig-like domain-containing protein [Gemmatimonadales bacterium]
MKTVSVRKLRFVPTLLLLAHTSCKEGKTEPSVAATIEANSATDVSAVAGTAVSAAPSVIVRDQNGNPFAGATVTFNVLAGAGTITGASAVTDASGVATVGEWTLGKTAGPNALSASSGSLSVSFNATGIAGPTAFLTVSAGDNQIAVAGSVLPISPAVLVQDANRNIKAGVTVTFAVGAGGGSVTGAAAISNATGMAAVGSWTLGVAPATNTLVASAAGAPSVTFSATAADAKCGGRTTHTLGSTTGGTLDANDCQLSDGSFIDFFSTVLPEANAYLFKQSAGFDTYLDLSLADGTVIAENDDETETNPNSAIKALLPAGTYLLGASSFNPVITGNYNVSSQVTSADNANCEVVFVVRNVSTTQSISATDCLWNAAPSYADAFYILMRAGQSITINMSSSDVDSYLQLVRVSGATVAQNDNRDATTKDARITFTATVTDYYAIFARTAIASQTGAYTLTIQ